jgi:hypothetical protein
MGYSYQIDPRPAALGGGWKLQLLEDGNEVGGGVFPPTLNPEQPAFDQAYQDALDEAENWISSRT